MDVTVHPQFEPKFGIGEKVWVLYDKNLIEATVQSIRFEQFHNSENQFFAICTGYRVDTINFDDVEDWFPPAEVYSNEETAKQETKWYRVENISEAEWKLAIGSRVTDEIEECELSRCCAVISNTRDLMIKCQNSNGLFERDITKLRALLKEHDYPMPNGQRPPILDKIIGQLGLLDDVTIPE